MSKTDFTKYIYKDEANNVIRFNGDLFDSRMLEYKGNKYPVVMQKQGLFITKASEKKDGKVSITYSNGTTKEYDDLESVLTLASKSEDNLTVVYDKETKTYEALPVNLLALMRQNLETENEQLKKDLNNNGKPQVKNDVAENKKRLTKGKKAKVVTGAVAGVLALGIAAGVGGWVANRFTQKGITDKNAISTENYTNWESFLADQTGTEIVNGSLRGDKGAISFWAEKDGKIGYYTANLEMMEKWAKESSNDPVLNWVRSVAGKNDEWLRTFNPEVMTALKNSIASGKVEIVNEFAISQNEVANVAINGKTYNLNGFVNDSGLTSVKGDSAAIIPNADGSRVEVVDVLDEVQGVVGKVAYAKILVGPSDYSKDATYVEKFSAVNIDDVKNMTEEQILSKVLNDGKIVAESEQKLYNATARLNIVEAKDTIVNAQSVYAQDSEETNALNSELRSKGIINSNETVVAKVGAGEDNKEYIKVKNAQGGNDLYVIVRGENGKIVKNQTEKYSSIDSYSTDKNMKEVLVYTIAGSILDDKDEIYVKSNQGTKNGKFTASLDVMVVDSQANSPTIYKAEDVLNATTADKQGTQALVKEMEARVNNTNSVIFGNKKFNLQKGEVVAQAEAESEEKGEVVAQAEAESEGGLEK